MQFIIPHIDQLDGVDVARLSGPVETSHSIIVGDPQIRLIFNDFFKQMTAFIYFLSALFDDDGNLHRQPTNEMHDGLVFV